jgi:hypothetical protein
MTPISEQSSPHVMQQQGRPILAAFKINCIKVKAMLTSKNEEKQSETDPHEGGRPHSDKQVAP